MFCSCRISTDKRVAIAEPLVLLQLTLLLIVKQHCSKILYLCQTLMNVLMIPTIVTLRRRHASISQERTYAVVYLASTVLLAVALAVVATFYTIHCFV